jgi:hypothetical protein
MSDLHPDTPDVPALQRRVLLAALVTALLFFAATGVITSLGQSTVWLLPAMVIIWFGVTRPLMAPVMAAIKLRRRLAYQAFLDQREEP